MAETSECTWMAGHEHPFAFQAACGHAFGFYEGSPAQSGFIFCPYCGSRLLTDHKPLSISNDKTEGRATSFLRRMKRAPWDGLLWRWRCSRTIWSTPIDVRRGQ